MVMHYLIFHLHLMFGFLIQGLLLAVKTPLLLYQGQSTVRAMISLKRQSYS
jgi:hypothetical protein